MIDIYHYPDGKPKLKMTWSCPVCGNDYRGVGGRPGCDKCWNDYKRDKRATGNHACFICGRDISGKASNASLCDGCKESRREYYRNVKDGMISAAWGKDKVTMWADILNIERGELLELEGFLEKYKRLPKWKGWNLAIWGYLVGKGMIR